MGVENTGDIKWFLELRKALDSKSSSYASSFEAFVAEYVSVKEPKKLRGSFRKRFPDLYSAIRESMLENGVTGVKNSANGGVMPSSAQLAVLLLAYDRKECPQCKQQFPIYRLNNPRFCSDVCGSRHLDSREKTKAVFRKNYGSEAYLSSETFLKVVKPKALAEHGLKSSFFEDPEVIAKRKKNWVKNLGVSNPMFLETTLKKREQTWLKNLGYRNPSHSPEVQAKMFKRGIAVKYSAYENGEPFWYQGAELSALRCLRLHLTIDSYCFYRKKLPAIQYFHEGKEHFYHPDFAFLYKGCYFLVEVKSIRSMVQPSFAQNVSKFKYATQFCRASKLKAAFLVIRIGYGNAIQWFAFNPRTVSEDVLGLKDVKCPSKARAALSCAKRVEQFASRAVS